MNQEKAREFFSNYYEGTLDPGLTQALERSMARDASIREDYKRFEHAYEDLGSLKFEAIEIPFDLNDRILANIDRHVYETKRNHQPAWTTWLRNVSIAGISLVAVLGAFLSLKNLNAKTSGAGVLPGAQSQKNELTVEPDTNRNAVVHFSPSSTEVLIVREGLGGPERQRTTVLSGKELTTTLVNSSPNATAFDLEASGSNTPTLIALPGSEPTAAKSGQGNLEAFSRALAGFYRVPVEICVAAPEVSVSWDFEAKDPEQAAISALDLQRYTIDRRANNLIVISDPEG